MFYILWSHNKPISRPKAWWTEENSDITVHKGSKIFQMLILSLEMLKYQKHFRLFIVLMGSVNWLELEDVKLWENHVRLGGFSNSERSSDLQKKYKISINLKTQLRFLWGEKTSKKVRDGINQALKNQIEYRIRFISHELLRHILLRNIKRSHYELRNSIVMT